MMDLSFIVVDIVFSIILLILGLVIIKRVSFWAGYRLTIFKLEKISKKEVLQNLKEKQRLLKHQEIFEAGKGGKT